MEEIKEQNTWVGIKYTLSLESGEIVKGDPREGLEYMNFVTGYNQVLPGLEKRLIGLKQGEETEFWVPPEEAFGPYEPSLVVEKDLDQFPQGRGLEPGRWVLARNPDHRVSFGYLVKEKKDHSVVLDYNHPLAGKSLHYRVVVTEVRAATPEELALLKPCQFDPQAGDQARED